MATSVLERSNVAPAKGSALARYLALEATVPVVLFASAAIVVGLHWDIAWHRAIGRDTFWSPPHVLEQIAAALAGLFCGWRVLYTSFMGTDADRGNAVRFWGIFHGPLGGWVCIWGTIAMITSAPFDNWWHAAYGLDVKILTPPHSFLALGMITVQLGAMLMMLAEQNRSAVLAAGDRRGSVFSASMGLIVLMAATLIYSDTGIPNLQHRPLFYQISAGVFPIFLLAALSITVINYQVIIPTFAKFALSLKEGGFGLLGAAFGIGAAIGAVLHARLQRNPNTGLSRVRLMQIGSILTCLSLAALAISPNLWLASLALVVSGTGMILFTVSANSSVQLATPDRLRGRVMSIYTLVFAGMSPLGALVAGGLMAQLGPRVGVLVLAALGLLASLVLRPREASSEKKAEGSM